MRVALLANNWVGWKAAEWLRGQGEEIVTLVMHPNPQRKYGEEISKSAGVDPSSILDGSRLGEPEVLDAVKGSKPDIGISIFFGYILRKEFLELVPRGCINVHSGFLPYNRGAHPNVWSIVEGTPSGATIHFIDDGVDTGDIIAQRATRVEPVDTGESLYRKLELTCLELFKATCPAIRADKANRSPQNRREGTRHWVRDVDQIDEIDLDRTYRARELIDIIRARTFSPYRGAYFRVGSRKVHVRLQLEYDESVLGDESDVMARNG